MTALTSLAWDNDSYEISADFLEPVTWSSCDQYGYSQSYCVDWSPTTCYHPAVDVATPFGTALNAPTNGTITCAGTGIGSACAGFACDNNGTSCGAGRIEMELSDGSRLIFGHCSVAHVQVGQVVTAGTLIAESGIAGTGDHVHIELRQPDNTCDALYRVVDPKPLLTGSEGSPANFSINDKIEVLDGPLNLRSGPGLSYSVVDSFVDGDQACVIGGPTSADGYIWFDVNKGGREGWLSGEACGLVTTGGCVSYSLTDLIKVTDGPLNVHSAPGFAGTVIASLATNTQMCVIGNPQNVDQYRWFQIDASGTQGWVAAAYTSLVTSHGCTSGDPNPLPTTGIIVGDVLQVTDGPLNLRTGPGTGYSTIASMPLNTKALVVAGPTNADGYTWHQIDTRYGLGWAAVAYMAETSSYVNRLANPTADTNLNNISELTGASISRVQLNSNYRVKCINPGVGSNEGMRYDSGSLSLAGQHWYGAVADVAGAGTLDTAKTRIMYADGSSSTYSTNAPILSLSNTTWKRLVVPVVTSNGKTVSRVELWIRRNDEVAQTFYTDNAKVVEL